jgi:FMN phosphatase YigB (HAD superfamily)
VLCLNQGVALKYSAVGFDLDGTLYPDLSLFVRLVPFFLKGFPKGNVRLLRALDKARMRLRGTGAYGVFATDFYETQARLMGEYLGEPTER